VLDEEKVGTAGAHSACERETGGGHIADLQERSDGGAVRAGG